jgi:hypothetical protein
LRAGVAVVDVHVDVLVLVLADVLDARQLVVSTVETGACRTACRD